MVMKSTNAYRRLTLYHILYIVCLLHVSATLVLIIREVHFEIFEPLHKYKTLSFQMCGIFFVRHRPEDGHNLAETCKRCNMYI